MATRRDFMALLAAAVGSGIIIAGCGDGGSGGGPGGSGTGNGGASTSSSPGPSGFRFIEVANSTSLTLPTNVTGSAGSVRTVIRDTAGPGASATFQAFPGAIQLTNGEQIYFHAVDGNGNVVLCVATVDFSSSGASLSSIQRVVGTGDETPDGSVISSIGFPQANASGTCATIISVPNQPPALYFGNSDTGLMPLLAMSDNAPGNNGTLGGDFTSLSLDDEANLATVVSYVPPGGTIPSQGVFYLVGGDPGHSDSGLLVSSQNLTASGLNEMSQFGLVTLSGTGSYVVQSTTEITPTSGSGSLSSGGAAGLPDSINLSGTIAGGPASVQVEAAPRGAVLNPLLSMVRGTPEGTSIYAPRVTSGGIVVQVIHVTDTQLDLYYGNTIIAQVNGLSPNGHPIYSMMAPVCGPDDSVCYVLFTYEGIELVMYDGQMARTILSRGDVVNGRTVNGIIFGNMPNQVDSQGRLTAILEYMDGTTGIVVGIPA